MLHCGSDGWGKLIGKMDVPDSRYLISVLSIVPPKIDIPEVIVLWSFWQQNLN
jgi:hypothetical protein